MIISDLMNRLFPSLVCSSWSTFKTDADMELPIMYMRLEQQQGVLDHVEPVLYTCQMKSEIRTKQEQKNATGILFAMRASGWPSEHWWRLVLVLIKSSAVDMWVAILRRGSDINESS